MTEPEIGAFYDDGLVTRVRSYNLSGFCDGPREWRRLFSDSVPAPSRRHFLPPSVRRIEHVVTAKPLGKRVRRRMRGKAKP